MNDQQRAPHILVVDDELFIRDAVKLYLESNGFRVSSADGREKALLVFNNRDDPVDVAILDLVMPGTHGLDLLREMKGVDPTVEIIIATGCGSMNSAIEALRHGAFDYITKPFVDFDEDLLASVNKALAARDEKISGAARSPKQPLAQRLALYDQINRLVETHAGEPPGEETWEAIWDLAKDGFSADAALLVERGKNGAVPVRSWGCEPYLTNITCDGQGVGPHLEEVARAGRDGVSQPPQKGQWSATRRVPLYGNSNEGELELILLYAQKPDEWLREAPHALLAAALGAVLYSARELSGAATGPASQSRQD